MRRDQRVNDNWALIHAQELALKNNSQLHVVFNLYTTKLKYPYLRHYDFMLKNLEKVSKNLQGLNVHFKVLEGNIYKNIQKYIKENNCNALVLDFSPLNQKQNKKLVDMLEIPIYEVDTHNISPIWETSNKQEYAARTIRPKVHKKINEYLEEFPKVKKCEQNKEVNNVFDAKECLSKLSLDETVGISPFEPGEKAAEKMLKDYLDNKHANYDEDRNDPNANALSNLSPYLHFGQISAQRVVLELSKKLGEINVNDSFFEEIVVRRELSDNYCYYNEHYNSVKGFPNWARQTLEKHKNDTREYIYTSDQLENSQTHDELWNACQKEMLLTGKMHGYLRMYWCKKILEWTKSVESAMKIATYLNDKYELDGRDPNGYVGIAWSLGGVHDRPWFDRPIFGTVRFMARSGCEKKFDVDKYINYVNSIEN